MQYRRKLIVIGLAVLFTLGFRAWNAHQAQSKVSPQASQEEWLASQWQSLWTTINFKAYTDSLTYQTLADSISSHYLTYSQQFKSRSSLDSIFYQSKPGDTLTVDSASMEVLKFALKAYDSTQHAIHPGIANLIQSYGLEYGDKPQVPPADFLQRELLALQTFPYRVINDSNIIVLQANRHLAFGAFSKGLALEWARQLLMKSNIENFWLEIGGDLVQNGHSIKGRPWRAGIQNPFALDSLHGISEFAPEGPFKSLATSGSYQQYFTDSLGVKHHHILDPRTARSVQGKASVSVLAHDGAQADLFATAFFILDTNDIRSILKSRSDLAAYVIFSDSTTWKSPHFEILIPEVLE